MEHGWILCVFILGAQLSKRKSVECCVEHQSSPQTTSKVFLDMFSAFFHKTVASVFCYPAGFEKEEQFSHWFFKRGHSPSLCGLLLETWQW